MKKKILFILIIILAIFLRIYRLDSFPPALYTDEADQGYNAYSILLTGRDEHGIFLPVSLRSFGDWKPPLPTYLMVPFIYLFGLNETSVRLSSVVLGIGSVVLSFFLVKELFRRQKYNTLLAFLSSFFLAISPWHIFQSRTAMLVIIGLFFLEAGVYFFIKGVEKRRKVLYRKVLYMCLSAVSFSLSIYAYYGLRLVTPLILLALIFHYRKNIMFLSKEVILNAIIGLLILLPLVLTFIKQPDVVLGRAKTVSVFYDKGVKLRQWELIAQDGTVGIKPLISRLFHNNVYMYGRDILERFLVHFDLDYLLLTGDKAMPFQIPNMGIIYFADALLIFIGAVFIYKERDLPRSLIIWWMIISIIPAAFTFMTPSSNRTFNATVPLSILTSLGVIYLLRRKLIFSTIISLIFAVSLGFFLRQYFIILPEKYADWWNYGMRQTVDYVRKVEKDYDNIVVLDGAMPYIYFLFYGKIDPSFFQSQAIRPYAADEFGFEYVEGFGKYIFSKDWQWQYLKDNLQEKSLYVVPSGQAIRDSNYIKEIKYPDGRIRFRIYSTL